jgi:hypothetical protein
VVACKSGGKEEKWFKGEIVAESNSSQGNWGLVPDIGLQYELVVQNRKSVLQIPILK